MPRRPWLAAAMLATGAFLVVSAQLAGAASDRRGGIFRVGTTGASVQVDPQLVVHHDGLVARVRDRGEALQLPDKKGRQGRSSDQRSRRGTSSRTAGSGTRSSSARDSASATARRSRRELQVRDQPSREQGSRVARRSVHHRLQRDDIVGAQAVNCGSQHGCERRPSPGQQADHQPDARQRQAHCPNITMPFFQATPTRLPLDREVADVRSLR